MKQLSKKDLEHLQGMFPVGTRVELITMNDIQAPPVGTCGTVQYVDALGDIGILWDNGSRLSIVLEAGDQIRRV
ncbi:MAG: DUF4314 domain-containing protein [Candidatus Weimeria sp.]